MNLTISQLNKIGERLRRGLATDEDLRLLDAFRLSFTPAYEYVFQELKKLGLNPGGRPQKTTLSIIAKLNRERTRLSRMQDIAGCRVEVDNLIEQDRIVDELNAKFPGAVIHDRRVKPHHGYRAVHLIVKVEQRPVEIQVRTSLQHGWASATEKLSDVLDPDIKYGGGRKDLQDVLLGLSKNIENFELLEMTNLGLQSIGRDIRAHAPRRVRRRVLPHIAEVDKDMPKLKADLKATCERLILSFLGNDR